MTKTKKSTTVRRSMQIHHANINDVSTATRHAKAAHLVTGRWIHNQAWTWDGGDAIVSICGRLPHVECWATVRLDNEIHSVCAPGVVQALHSLGVEDIEVL